MTEINTGDIVRVTTSPGFTNSAGVLTDPTTVTLRWRVAGGTETVYTWTAAVPGTDIVKDSVGIFHAYITVVAPGTHYLRWEGTGAVVAAEEATFSVKSYFS